MYIIHTILYLLYKDVKNENGLLPVSHKLYSRPENPGRDRSQPFYTIFVLRQLKLPGIKLIIFALLPKQIIVVAALNNAAVFQHHDCVGVAHG